MLKRTVLLSITCGLSHLCAFQSDFSNFEKIDYPKTPALAEYISPVVADWDGDGITDVIVGDLSRENFKDRGRVLFYRNSGSNGNPQLEAPIILKDENGNEITAAAS